MGTTLLYFLKLEIEISNNPADLCVCMFACVCMLAGAFVAFSHLIPHYSPCLEVVLSAMTVVFPQKSQYVPRAHLHTIAEEINNFF